jgi:hypothetical protein
LRLTFEFTRARTLQRNYLVEVGFAMLWGRLRATMDAVFIPEEEKYKLVREGIFRLTFLDGLIVREVDGVMKTKYRHLFGDDPKIRWPMRVWGEAGMIKITGKVQSNLDMRGAQAMFVGFARESSADTYCMYVPEMNSVHETRDVQWAKKMYYEPEKPMPIQAADSVDLMLNRNTVPLRTVPVANKPPSVVQAKRNGGSHVKFGRQTEIIPEREPGTSMIVEIDLNQEEELSTMTSSSAKTRGKAERPPARHVQDNFCAILDLGVMMEKRKPRNMMMEEKGEKHGKMRLELTSILFEYWCLKDLRLIPGKWKPTGICSLRACASLRLCVITF